MPSSGTLASFRLLNHLPPLPDPDFTDAGIHAWRALESQLDEPLRSFLDPEPLRLLGELGSDFTPHHRREEIGLRLNQMGDPRRGVGLDANGIPEIAWIDAGKVTLDTGETFQVGRCSIGKYPVTWEQYRAFLEGEDGYHNPRWWD